MASARDVLDFWFSDRGRARWWDKDAAFDDEIRATFGATIEAAGRGALDSWATTANGALALVILLDQFTRNIHRGSDRAFAYDAKARELADAAVRGGLDAEVSLEARMFLYMPFQHSEALADQDRSVALFQAWIDQHDAAQRPSVAGDMEYALRHREIVQRFGRFPHRNAVLGRTSTPDEVAFLQGPGSSF